MASAIGLLASHDGDRLPIARYLAGTWPDRPPGGGAQPKRPAHREGGVTPSPVNTPNDCPECRRLSGKRIDFIVGDITWLECGACGHVWKQPQSEPKPPKP
jgi:hypothetical protein